jgi:ankyrin repeat protein
MRGSSLCKRGIESRQRRLVAQAFRPANRRRAALKGCATGFAILLSALAIAAETDTRLIQAVKNRDADSVRALLKQHVDVNATQGDGATALHWAAHRDDLVIADLLIRAGARASVADDLGTTPLHLACTNRSAAMVERLLSADANGNAALPSGETALMTCARAGDARAVKALLAHGADVNATEHEHHQTALMWAVAQRHPDVVRLLIDSRADVRARSATYAQTVVGEQTQRAGREELNYTVWRGGATPLLFAARVGDVESARLLLTAGADANDSQPDGISALVLAAHSGNGPVAVLLLEHGADPNADGSGYTALHAASRTGDTALHVAAALGYDTVVQFLVERGASVSVKNARGVTPLMAAMFGSTVARGRAAAPAGADSLGFEPPIDLVHPSTVALLRKLGAAE